MRARGLAITGLVAGAPPPPCGRERGDSRVKRSDRGERPELETLTLEHVGISARKLLSRRHSITSRPSAIL